MTIYIDIVLIENIIMNSIILIATAIIIKEKVNYMKIFLASTLGAIYSVIAYMNILEVYSNFILKFVLSILIVYISYNPSNMKRLLKQIIIFYLTFYRFSFPILLLSFIYVCNINLISTKKTGWEYLSF